MNLKSAFLIFSISFLFLTSCRPDDNTSITPPRDRQEVYEEDITEIEEYLKSNYLTIDAEMNATVNAIPENGPQTSIWDQTDYPLQSITVKNDVRVSYKTNGRIKDDVEYKLYYIVLNEGGGVTPKSVDSTFVAYKGWNLENVIFDQNNSGTWFSFPEPQISAISGFRQILSQIKTEASSSLNSDGTITRVNYGNVIVFIPSGLAYFNSFRTNISTYSPIAFQIKLFSRKERDHDNDKISSQYEDLNDNNDYFDDDTDGDLIPDFLDIDDDGDGFTTRTEIIETNDGNGTITYYSFNNIPSCIGSSIKRHVDATCKPPF